MGRVGIIIENAVLLGGRATHSQLFDRMQDFFSALKDAEISASDEFNKNFLALADKTLFLDLHLAVSEIENARQNAACSFAEVCGKFEVLPTKPQKQRLINWFKEGKNVDFSTLEEGRTISAALSHLDGDFV